MFITNFIFISDNPTRLMISNPSSVKDIGMNPVKMICLLFLTNLPIESFAGDRPAVIYGDDNRMEPFLYSDARFRILARSVAAQIDPKELLMETMNEQNENNSQSINKFLLQPHKLKDDGICRSERFSNQPVASRCSGFLVGKDILVTAGHCITSQEDCHNFLWAFGYSASSVDLDGENIKLKENNIYSCKNIIARSQNRQFKDFAVIQLDRAVIDRNPLRLRTSLRPINVGEKVLVIGHPSGLPLKITDGANVTSLEENIFYANLDTYGGNSGSPVFNEETGEVEGILVIGNDDYVKGIQVNDDGEMEFCGKSNHLPQNMRKAEGVSYISHVLPFLKSKI